MVGTTEEKLFGTIDVYRVIVDAAEEGIWVADQDDKVTFVNKKLVDILGYPQDEIIGKKIFDFTDEENRVVMKESIKRSRKGKRDIYPFNIRNKSGKFIPFIVATTSMQDEKGQYIGTVQLCSDMSVQKKIEDELREAKVKADIYLDLLSHDIRNMDQVAIGYLDIVIDKLDAGISLTKANRDLIEKPLNALFSSLELIDNVKTLKKEKTSKLPKEKVDLGVVVSGILTRLSRVPGRTINIHHYPVKDCWVEANYMLNDVFINLIGNAIKHSSGPLDIYVDINMVTSERIQYYAVTVEDSGPGIPDDLKSKLFTNLYCYMENMKTHNKHIGLCLVKALVGRFHGNIQVEDRVPGDYKKGAKFVVRLPAIEK